MSPQEYADRKAKLLQRANDFRGNENERLLASESYRKMCENPPPESAAPDRPEFNRVERALIRFGAVLFLGTVLFADLIKAKRRRRGPRGAEAYRVPRNA